MFFLASNILYSSISVDADSCVLLNEYEISPDPDKASNDVLLFFKKYLYCNS
jgi:hypothetical protein